MDSEFESPPVFRRVFQSNAPTPRGVISSVRRVPRRIWQSATRVREAQRFPLDGTAKQVIALKITEAYAKDFPGGHERFVRLLHEELSKR